MRRFSANLGFLWTEHALPEAIRAAHTAGFDAVECHWPFDEDPTAVSAALVETGLPMLGLNTRRGDVDAGENGLAAVPGKDALARAAIDEALHYAATIGAQNVHVMAGYAEGDAAEEVFCQNLAYAVEIAAPLDIGLLIEPLNRFDAPGYFLRDTAHACAVIDRVGADTLKLMFDCYHVGRTEGDVTGRLKAVQAYVGHIQFASVPDRAAPDQGTLDYQSVFAEIDALGWAHPLGAEYKPGGATEATLGWLPKFRT